MKANQLNSNVNLSGLSSVSANTLKTTEGNSRVRIKDFSNLVTRLISNLTSATPACKLEHVSFARMSAPSIDPRVRTSNNFYPQSPLYRESVVDSNIYQPLPVNRLFEKNLLSEKITILPADSRKYLDLTSEKRVSLSLKQLEEVEVTQGASRSLIESSSFQEFSSNFPHCNLTKAEKWEEQRDCHEKHLTVWDNLEQKGLDLKYQSKVQGQQAFGLALDNLGNLSIKIDNLENLSWWLSQRVYLQSALKDLGYLSFQIESAEIKL